MSEMIDKVAQALFRFEWANKGHSWEMESEHHDYWREAARVAIEAMRDPTSEVEGKTGIEKARAEEREACAQIADAWAEQSAGFTEQEATALEIAAAIRARSAPPPQEKD